MRKGERGESARRRTMNQGHQLLLHFAAFTGSADRTPIGKGRGIGKVRKEQGRVEVWDWTWV